MVNPQHSGLTRGSQVKVSDKPACKLEVMLCANSYHTVTNCKLARYCQTHKWTATTPSREQSIGFSPTTYQFPNILPTVPATSWLIGTTIYHRPNPLAGLLETFTSSMVGYARRDRRNIMADNPNCNDYHCNTNDGVVKLYPIGGGENLILCHTCWANNNRQNYIRGIETNQPQNFPQHDWYDTPTYPGA